MSEQRSEFSFQTKEDARAEFFTRVRARAGLPDVDGCFRVVSALVSITMRDAMRGDAEARAWLDALIPDWRDRQARIQTLTQSSSKHCAHFVHEVV